MRNQFAAADPLATIILHGKNELEAIVDYGDLLRAAEFPGTWRVQARQGALYCAGTLRRYDPESNQQIVEDVLLHRWILRSGPDQQVAHRNGDGLDCRRENLEIRHLARPRQGRRWSEEDRRSQEEGTLRWFAELRRRLEKVSGVTPAQALAAAEQVRAGRFPSSKRLSEHVDTVQAEMRRQGIAWPIAPRARLRSGWQDHLEAIFAELEAMPAHTLIGRQEVERLFRLSRASAGRLLNQFGAERFGNVYLIEAATLAARLKALGAAPLLIAERHRRQRVRDIVSTEASLHAARRVKLSPPPSSATSLPAGVSITPGEIRIRYTTAEEAASHMLALGLLAQADWDDFRRLLLPENDEKESFLI